MAGEFFPNQTGIKTRIPVVTDLHIKEFGGGSIGTASSYMQNAIIAKRGDGSLYVTQRPSFNLVIDASATVSDIRGRGLYYWPGKGLYIINDDTIYKDAYSNVVGTITSGYLHCNMVECGDYLVVVDAQNNEAWTINSSDTLAKITDADFPTTLAYGVVQLNQRLFVIDEVGTLYQSDLNNPTSWQAANIITAERENDSGVYAGKHHDHIIAFGGRTIEFFYDAGNATGSVLSRRADVSYNLGVISGDTVWEDKDITYFIGMDSRGTVGAYTLEGFQLNKVSTDTIDSFLTSSILRDGINFTASGLSAHGHVFYIITLYTVSGSTVSGLETIVYDRTSGVWSTWSSNLTQLLGLKFPLVSWTIRGGASLQYGQGILSNGDVISISDYILPYDSALSIMYVTPSNYVDAGYYTDIAGSGTNISLVIRLTGTDFGIINSKFIHCIEFVGEFTTAPQTLTVKWDDGASYTFNNSRAIDISKRSLIKKLGKYTRRNWQLEYSGDEILRMDALELTFDVGVK